MHSAHGSETDSWRAEPHPAHAPGGAEESGAAPPAPPPRMRASPQSPHTSAVCDGRHGSARSFASMSNMRSAPRQSFSFIGRSGNE